MTELNHVYVRSTVVNIWGLASDGELDPNPMTAILNGHVMRVVLYYFLPTTVLRYL